MRAGEAHADLDLARRAEGMGGVAEIVRADRLHQLARLRPHDAEHRLGRRHVGDDDEVIAQMPAQPGEVALQRRAGHDQQEGGLATAG